MKKVLKFLFHFVLIVSLLVSGVALFAAYIWSYEINAINTYDQEQQTAYNLSFWKPYYEARFDFAKNYPVNDKERAIATLEALSERLEAVGRYETLHYLKRNVQKQLILLHLTAGDKGRALDLAREWNEKDDRDLEAKVYWGLAMMYTDSLKAKAPEYIAKFKETYYNYDLELLRQMDVLLTSDRHEFTVNLTSDAYRIQKIQDYFWMFKSNGVDWEKVPTWTTRKTGPDQYEAVFEVDMKQHEVLKFVINTPTRDYILANIKTTISTPTQSYVMPLEEMLELHQLSPVAEGPFIATGPDPFFKFYLTGPLDGYEGPLEIKFEVHLYDPVYMPWLEEKGGA